MPLSLFAGHRRHYSAEAVTAAVLAGRPRSEFTVYPRAEVLSGVATATPASFGNLDIVWQMHRFVLPTLAED